MISRGGGTIQATVGGASIQQQIKVTNSIRPVSVSTNVLPSGINERDKLLTSGEATFKPGRSMGSRALKIQGIFEPAGTRCVRVNISRNGPADIFRFRTEVGDDATIALVDVAGNNYSPIGYIYKHSEGTTIKLAPTRRVRTIDDLPTPPTSGSQQLDLLFYVTEGVTIIGLRFGDIDVGTCSLAVPSSS